MKSGIMEMKKIILLSSLLLASPVFAVDVAEYKDGAVEASNEKANEVASNAEKQQTPIIYQEPTGVQAELNEDGSIKKILASGEAKLEFGDAKDKRQAVQKATLRAKAAIAKFLTESIKTTETLDEIQKTVNNAKSDGSKLVTRETIETQAEIIENKAEEILQGVVTLQQDIDPEKKLVTVTVGMKEETIQAAKDLKGKIESSETSSASTEASDIAASEQTGKEVRRSKSMDSF